MESFISLFEPDETDTETTSSDSESVGKIPISHLPPEPQFGNIEYKLKLTNPSKQRLEHLITQLKWRLNEGNGEAIYEIGVTDSGFLHGLNEVDMNSSLETLRIMATELNATVDVQMIRRNVESGRSSAKVVVKKMTDNKNIEEIRISVMGPVDSGKSTLIGVLTQGELDNGRGRARLQMFRHYHEIKSGRTSSIAHEILGFDDFGTVINYKDNAVTAEEISEMSTKLVSFMDLAGHRRYMRTTIQAVSGYAPHYIALVTACYSNGSLNQMTIENLQLIKAFKIPFFVIITKIDLVTCRDETLQQLKQLLNDVDKLKKPVVMTSMDDIIGLSHGNSIPIFCVSNLTGEGLDLVQKYLFTLTSNMNLTEQRRLEQEPIEFHIDEIISHQGAIVGGLLVKGQINEKMKIKLGPDKNGGWTETTIQSIHRNKFPCKSIKSNQCASVCFSVTEKLPALRGGMVLLAENDESSACIFFQATIVVIQMPSIKGMKKGLSLSMFIGCVRQTAVIEGIFGRENLSANETGSCLFRFLSHPEFIRPGMSLLFRDGNTKGVGCVTQVFPLD